MAAVTLSPVFNEVAYFDAEGDPLAGGKLYQFIAGSSTVGQATYTDSIGTVANPNPIVLDSAGRNLDELWLVNQQFYRLELRDADDTVIKSMDNVVGTSPGVTASIVTVETATATQGQTVFNLTNQYTVGANALQVSLNGAVQVVNVDYTETAANQVTFATGLNSGDVLLFKVFSTSLYTAPSSSTVSYNQGDAGAVNRFVSSRLQDFVTAKDFGATGNGTTDDTTFIQAALNTGKQVWLPAGTYKITAPLVITQGGLRGASSKNTTLLCVATHAIQISSGTFTNRYQCVISDLAIRSSTGTNCDDKFAVYVPGVASGAASSYNSGITIERVDIGAVGRMGGGFYLKDTFRVNIQNIGMTDVSRMIQVVGSNVQLKVRNVTANNDNAGTTLLKYGISTETASYSDIGTAGPENCRFIDCSYIRGTRGINHTVGLDIEFVNFDTEADVYGAFLNAACNIRGGVLAPGPQTGAPSAWTGIFRGVSPSEPDDGTIIREVDVNCLRAPGTPGSSYGIDLGDGASPVYGVIVKECRIRGLANSLNGAIRGRDLRDATLEDNFIRATVVQAAGTEVSLTGRRVWCNRNRVSTGEVSVSDGGESTAYGSIKHNQCGTLTLALTTPSQWEIGNNEAVTPYRKLLGVLTGTATFDPANLAPLASTNTTVTVTGAAVGDPATASITTMANANLIITATVTADDTVRVIFFNGDTGAVNLSSGTVKVTVTKV